MIRQFLKEHPNLDIRIWFDPLTSEIHADIYERFYKEHKLGFSISLHELDMLNVNFETAIMIPVINAWNKNEEKNRIAVEEYLRWRG